MADLINNIEKWECRDENGAVVSGHTNQGNALEKVINEAAKGRHLTAHATVTCEFNGVEPPPPVVLPKLSITPEVIVTEGETAVFELTLDKVYTEDVSVDYFYVLVSASAQDLVPRNGTAVIPAGALSTTVQVEIIDDDIVEPNEYFRLELVNEINCELVNDFSLCTIVDNDVTTPEPPVDPPEPPVIPEGEWPVELKAFTLPANGVTWEKPQWAVDLGWGDYLPSKADSEARIVDLEAKAELTDAEQSELTVLKASFPRPAILKESELEWPAKPVDPEMFRWDDSHVELVGGCRIYCGNLVEAKWLTTMLAGFHVRGSVDNPEFLIPLHINATAPMIQVNVPMTLGKDASQWTNYSVVNANPDNNPNNLVPSKIFSFVEMPRFKKDYTQIRAFWYGKYILFGTRNGYNTGTSGARWSSGIEPWLGVYDTETGETQTFALEGYSPQNFGGGFTKLSQSFADAHFNGRDLLLNRGGALSGQGSANGPCALIARLTDAGIIEPQVTQYHKWGTTDIDDPFERPPDYTLGLFAPKHTTDLNNDGWGDIGYWSISSMTQGYAFVDRPNLRGMLACSSNARGTGNYYYYSATHNTNPIQRIFVVDPNQHVEVLKGLREARDVKGTWYGFSRVAGCDQLNQISGIQVLGDHIVISYDLGWNVNKHQGAGFAIFKIK